MRLPETLPCPRCAGPQPIRVNEAQVRCARCGSFLLKKAALATLATAPKSGKLSDADPKTTT